MISNDSTDQSLRAGKYIQHADGYRTFLPKLLPPNLDYDDELQFLLSSANVSLGKLDGAIQILPNPDIFVHMFVCKEAVLSSQIEGTQSTLVDLLQKEAKIYASGQPDDVDEVSNYVTALNRGIQLLQNDRISISLLLQVHKLLLQDLRGAQLHSGELRTDIVWIGPKNSDLNDATFIPPPPELIETCLNDLLNFTQAEDSIPPLVKAGLVHAQFETIHPFYDGNGRIGRLLITLMLHEKKILQKPILYLSLFLKANRTKYYEALQAVRDHGDWESWIKFFLTGVLHSSKQSAHSAQNIIALREEVRETLLSQLGGTAANALRLHESLFQLPYTDVTRTANLLNIRFPAANRLIDSMVKHNVLVEITGNSRNRLFAYKRYIEIVSEN